MDRRFQRIHSSASPSPSHMSRSATPQDMISPSVTGSELPSEWRRKLQERRQKRQSRLSVPHIDTEQLRSSTPDSIDQQAALLEQQTIHDHWTEEAGTNETFTPRKPHVRRASLAGSAKQKGTPSQEMESSLAKLEKQNYDLALRVCMQEDRAKKLEIDLQEALNTIKDLAQVNEFRERKNEEQEERIQELEEEKAQLVSDNQEMFLLYDELVADIEQKDHAISEAADMVCEIEDKKDSLDVELSSSQQRVIILEEELKKWKALAEGTTKASDSDYYSAETERSELSHSFRERSDSRPSSARQSDYFSAESVTNKTAGTPSPSKEPRGLKSRLQNLTRSMKPTRTHRVGELRAKASYSTLNLTSDSLSSHAPFTASKSSRDDLLQRMQAPIMESLKDDITEVSSVASWSHQRRGSAPNWALRHRYLEGEHVGGLAQLRTPLVQSPGAESPVTARSSMTTPRPTAIQRASSSCGFRTSTDRQSVPLIKESRRFSRGRPELTRLTTTIPSTTSTVGSGVLDRTTAWLGTLPKPGGDTPRDMIFNRNAEDFGPSGHVSANHQTKDAVSRALWP